MNLDSFEKKLKEQKFAPPPPELKRKVLAGVRESSASMSSKVLELRNLLWPSPKAWGALAALWLVFLGLQVFSRTESSPSLAVQPTPAIQKNLLSEQLRLRAELLRDEPTQEPDTPERAPRGQMRRNSKNILG